MTMRSMAVVGLVLWGAAVVAAAVAGRPAPAPAPSTNALSATVSAAGLRRIEISAGQGQVEVGVTPGDQIEIAVALESGGAGVRLLGASPGDAARTALDAVVQGQTLRARVTGATGDGLIERWAVRVPARLAAEVTLRRGAITVTGVEGGVRASADSGLGQAPGAMAVDVPRGPLMLTMGVGTIRAHTGETPPGDIDVQSRVGHARLSLEGHDHRHDRSVRCGRARAPRGRRHRWRHCPRERRRRARARAVGERRDSSRTRRLDLAAPPRRPRALHPAAAPARSQLRLRNRDAPRSARAAGRGREHGLPAASAVENGRAARHVHAGVARRPAAAGTTGSRPTASAV